MPPVKRPRHPSTLPLALAALVASTCPITTHADTATWASAVSGNWTDATNWLPGVVPNNGIPPGTNYDALINATGSSYTVTLSAAATINSLTLNSPTATLLLPSVNPTPNLVLNAPSTVQGGTIDLQPYSILDLGNNTLTLSGTSSSLVLAGGMVQNGVLASTNGASITVASPTPMPGSVFGSVTFVGDPTISVHSTVGMENTTGNVTLSYDAPMASTATISSATLGSNISIVTGTAGGWVNCLYFGGTASAQTPNTDITFDTVIILTAGLVRAINGATVHFFIPPHNAGTIFAGAGSTVFINTYFSNNIFSSNGTLSTDGGDLILANTQSGFIPTGTVTLGGTIQAIDNGTINFSVGIFSITSPISLTSSSAIFNGKAQSITTITGTGFVSIGDGKSLTSDGITANSLQLGINSTHTIRPNTGGASIVAGASKLSTLTLAGSPGNWSSLLDLTNNALIIQATSFADKENKIATLLDQVNQARGGLANTWTGTAGITSSTVAAADHVSTGGMGLAVADAAELPNITNLSTYRGQAVDSNSIIIVAAHTGDVTLDGRIDISDLNAVTSHWQQTGALWSEGDTASGPNGGPNGTVDIADLNAVTSFWQYGTGSGLAPAGSPPLVPQSSSPVPEPASLAVMLVAGASLLVRKRCRRARDCEK